MSPRKNRFTPSVLRLDVKVLLSTSTITANNVALGALSYVSDSVNGSVAGHYHFVSDISQNGGNGGGYGYVEDGVGVSGPSTISNISSGPEISIVDYDLTDLRNKLAAGSTVQSATMTFSGWGNFYKEKSSPSSGPFGVDISGKKGTGKFAESDFTDPVTPAGNFQAGLQSGQDAGEGMIQPQVIDLTKYLNQFLTDPSNGNNLDLKFTTSAPGRTVSFEEQDSVPNHYLGDYGKLPTVNLTLNDPPTPTPPPTPPTPPPDQPTPPTPSPDQPTPPTSPPDQPTPPPTQPTPPPNKPSPPPPGTPTHGKGKKSVQPHGKGRVPKLLSGDAESIKNYTEKVAEQSWSRNGDRAAKNLNSDKELDVALAKAASGKEYITQSDLRTVTSIEAGADRKTGVNKFGYAGLFQMGPAASKDVGYDYTTIKNPRNWEQNVEAGAAYLEQNAERLSANGLPVNAQNIYLAHQQGASGAEHILQAVQDGSATKTSANTNMLNNLPKTYVNSIRQVGQQVTIQNYYDYWSDSFRAVSSKVNGK